MTKPRILIVEDNEMNRDMLSRRLTRLDFEVAAATDGEMGVAMATATATETKPDLILMDMSLPKLDGWQATAQIKKLMPAIPIIALTAHAMDGDRKRALDAGCDDYDTKPVDITRLVDKIRALLPKP